MTRQAVPVDELRDSLGSPNRAPLSQKPARSGISDCLKPLPRPEWLPKSQWPFQTVGLDLDGSTIAITDVGQGPVLLFVHTGFWSFVWRDLILRLASDFRCVCFDAPGTGQSDRRPVRGITLERASRALTAVIEALRLTDITLIFHDLGGPSGIAGAARMPERIRGLCAVNAFAWKPSGIAEQAQTVPRAQHRSTCRGPSCNTPPV